ncbi:MAG: hypothetical protein ACTSXY_09125 [Promethearchaeota archaeon]
MDNHSESIKILREVIEYFDDKLKSLIFIIAEDNPGVLIDAYYKTINREFSGPEREIYKEFKNGLSKVELIRLYRERTDASIANSKIAVEKVIDIANNV